MSRAGPIEGGCLCGTVRYRIDAPVDWVAHCCCSMCRKASGGAFMTWLKVPASGFAFTGSEPATYRSSPGLIRSHCPHCGAQIHGLADSEPEAVYFTIATLDQPQDLPAQRTDWAEDALPKIELDAHLPRYASEGPEEAPS